MDLASLSRPGFSPTDLSVKKPGFFQHGGLGEKILHGLSEFSLRYSARNGDPFALATLQDRMSQARQKSLWEHDAAERAERRKWDVEDRDAKLRQPQYFMSGRDRVAFDPTTNQSNVIYDGAEDYENYADTLGLSPGDEGYDTAVNDFVLRGNGPTALAGRQALEGTRQQNRMSLRSTPTYANLHPAPRAARSSGRRGGMAFSGPPRTTGNVYAPILAKVVAGQPLSPGEQEVYNNYRSRGGRGGAGGGGSGGGGGGVAPPASAPRTMRNPKTGQTIKLVNGKWIPA